MNRKTTLILLFGLAACGNANFAGAYTISTTDGANGCNMSGWTQGQTSTDISFAITQTGSNVTGTVGGLTGAYLAVVFGTQTFSGTVGGNSATMTLQGKYPLGQGACAYNWNARVDCSLSGDTITGTIIYFAATNNASDCATGSTNLETCQSVQNFNGIRPPSAD